MIKFTFGLEACMTKQEDDGEKIYYTNKVYLKAGQPADDEVITRVHTEIIPFKCGYDKNAVISKVSYSPRSTLVITDAGNLVNRVSNPCSRETCLDLPLNLLFLFRHLTRLSTKLPILAVCRRTVTCEPGKWSSLVRHESLRSSVPNARWRPESGKSWVRIPSRCQPVLMKYSIF